MAREFIRLICFALVGKILFKAVFHRTLEFNLLLSISLITVSFLAFFNKWYYFASSSIKRHSLDSPLLERSFLSRSRSLIAVRISSESHDGFFIDSTLTDLSAACRSIFHIEYKGFLFVDFMLVILTVSFKFPKYVSQTFLPLLSLLILMYVFTFLFDV